MRHGDRYRQDCEKAKQIYVGCGFTPAQDRMQKYHIWVWYGMVPLNC